MNHLVPYIETPAVAAVFAAAPRDRVNYLRRFQFEAGQLLKRFASLGCAARKSLSLHSFKYSVTLPTHFSTLQQLTSYTRQTKCSLWERYAVLIRCMPVTLPRYIDLFVCMLQ